MDIPFLQVPRAFFEGGNWLKSRKFSNSEILLDIAYMIAYKGRRQELEGKVFMLEKGECVATMRFMEKRWGWSNTKIETTLKTLEKMYGLKREKRQGFTVLKFDLSKAYEDEQNRKTTEKRQKRGTKNDGKNDEIEEGNNKEESISKENNIKEILESRLLRIARCVFPNAKMPRPAKELRAWSKISKSVTDEQIDLVEKFHALDKSDSYDETWHRKQDVPALMNNWQSTIELAGKFFAQSRDRKADGLDKKNNSPPYFQNNQESDDAASWSLRR